MYVQPRAFFEKKKRDAKAGLGDCDSPGAARETVKVVVGLEEHLDAWLGRGDKADALRVLSGGPGSGKSCFAKMFAARQAGQGRRVLYMPLHLLDAKGELVSEAGKVLLAGGILGHNPLASENGEERLLLILDGLDELAMLGKIAREHGAGVCAAGGTASEPAQPGQAASASNHHRPDGRDRGQRAGIPPRRPAAALAFVCGETV